MQANADRCIANTLKYEGAFGRTRADRGDWDSGKVGVGNLIGTNWGIAAMTMRERGLPAGFDLRSLTRAQAIELYKRKEWPESYGNQWPMGLDQVTYDAVVNSGKGRLTWTVRALGAQNVAHAIEIAQKADTETRKAAVKKQIAIRLAFLRGLSTFNVFGRGWTTRCVGMEAIGVRMVLEAAGLHPVERKKELEAEAGVADNKKAGSAAGAGAGATPAAGANQIDPATFDWTAWAFVGVTTLAAVSIIAFFVFQWWKNHERSKAYRLEAAAT